jgi:MFS family permease
VTDRLAQHRPFQLFWAGQTLSAVGDAITAVALPLVILKATGSVQQMGLVTSAGLAGALVATACAGFWVDRWDRRRLMIACDLVRCVLLAAIPLAWWLGLQGVWLVYTVSIASAFVASLFYVAQVAMVAELVGRAQVGAANSRLQGTMALSFVVGPLVAGLVSRRFGPERALGFDALSFLVSAVSLSLVKRSSMVEESSGASAPRGSIATELLAGLRFVYEDTRLFRLALLVGAYSLVGAATIDLFIFRLKHDVGQDDTGVGTMFALASVGSVIAALSTPWLRRRLSFGAIWSGGVALQAAALLATVGSRSFPLLMFAAAVFMAAMTTLGICQVSFRQEVTPARLLGRVTSGYLLMVAIPGPIGAVLATGLAERLGASRVHALVGLALGALAVIARAVWPREGEASPRERSTRSLAALLVPVAIAVAVATAAIARVAPPSPQPQGAPPDVFSAARARAELDRVLPDSRPHPLGSAANDAVRDRIVLRLRELGFEPEVQTAPACGDWGRCATVNNVLARRAGQGSRAVLLSVHYDSVEAGPGAGDNLASVAAALEIARVVMASPPLEQSIVFAFTDGEEYGSLGATAFVERHAWAHDVDEVVNLDARGVSGPSLLFESSRDISHRIDVARALPHPVLSSVFPTFAAMLPNGTDFGIYRAHGYAGVGFAFIGRPALYHTPLDSADNVDAATLQHQGDNALAMVRGLAARPRAPGSGATPAVFFDVLSLFVVAWPSWLGRVLAAAALAGVALVVLRLRKAGRLAWSELGFGALAWTSVPGAAALAYGASELLAMNASFGARFVASPAAGVLAFAALAVFVVAGACALVARRTSALGLFSAGAVAHAVLGAVLAFGLPGASYLFVVPSLAAACAALPFAFRMRVLSTVTVPAAAFALVLAPVLGLLSDGLGTASLPFVTALTAPIVFALAGPLVDLTARARRVVVVLAGALSVAGVVTQLGSAPFTPASPEHVRIFAYEDADAPASRLVVLPIGGGGVVPPELVPPGAPGWTRGEPFEWTGHRRAYFTERPRFELPAPELVLVSDRSDPAGRILTLRATSRRGARRVRFAFARDAAVNVVSIEGTPVPAYDPSLAAFYDGWRHYEEGTASPLGTEIVIHAEGPVQGLVMDITSELPAAAQALASARPSWVQVEGDGDEAIAARHFRF